MTVVKIDLPVWCAYDYCHHTVEAELVDIPHLWPWTFAVHLALVAQKEWSYMHYSVTNIETGMSVAMAPSREAAIELARCRMLTRTLRDMERAVESAPAACRE